MFSVSTSCLSQTFDDFVIERRELADFTLERVLT